MRILFTSGPLYGHVNTLLPLAMAAHRRGHDVVFATGPGLVPQVAQRGLATWAVGPEAARSAGRPASWLDHFAAQAHARAANLVPRAIAWQPELVIHEETDLAGPLIAAKTGARHVVHGLGLMPSTRVWGPFAAAIEDLAHRWGVVYAAEALREATYLHICPPALQPFGERIFRHVLPLRPAAGEPFPGERLPDAIDALPFEDTIHLTLGTVFNDATGVLAQAIAGLRGLPLNLVVTLGPNGSPEAFGPQPAHVLLERYLPHALLLPRCRLVVSQGGAGILFGALAHGLPQLVMPQGAEQFLNAEACVRSGAGLSLAGEAVSSEAIAAAATRLLSKPGYAERAAAIRAEIEAMPDADAVLSTLTASDAAIARRGSQQRRRESLRQRRVALPSTVEKTGP